ncbi:MAG: hypothetical protein KAS65_07970 [Candidatus Aminicenantes bacterium]|nr:hypothetical protein [Candidatus Aminicenantes bacterium]
MKKLFTLVTIFVFLSMMFACGGGKYADAKKVMGKFISITNDFVSDMEKADDADSTAAAINAYAHEMEHLSADMKKIQEKYPEIKDQENPPEELKELAGQMEEVMPKMMAAMMKLAKYAQEPAVMEAQKKLQQAMGELR